MNLIPLCEMEMHYTWVDFVDYGVGGQYVGTLEGIVKGDRLRGTLKSVNVPARRPRQCELPRLPRHHLHARRAKINFEFNGAWVNDTAGAVEGILNTATDRAIVRAFACVNELATVAV